MAGAAVYLAKIGLILWIRYNDFWKVDACLNSGGAWNYSGKQCQH